MSSGCALCTVLSQASFLCIHTSASYLIVSHLVHPLHLSCWQFHSTLSPDTMSISLYTVQPGRHPHLSTKSAVLPGTPSPVKCPRHPLAWTHIQWNRENMLSVAESFLNKNLVSISKISFRVISKSLKYPQAWLFLLVNGRVARKSGKERRRLWKEHLILQPPLSLSSEVTGAILNPCNSTWIKHNFEKAWFM